MPFFINQYERIKKNKSKQINTDFRFSMYILQVKSYDQWKKEEEEEEKRTNSNEKRKRKTTNIVICVCFYQSWMLIYISEKEENTKINRYIICSYVLLSSWSFLWKQNNFVWLLIRCRNYSIVCSRRQIAIGQFGIFVFEVDEKFLKIICGDFRKTIFN